jgi:hypothetical protein
MIALHLRAYLAIKARGIKTGMVEHIVRKVRESGGKFVKKDGNSGEWFDIGDKEAHKKVGHAFRDAHSESKVRDSLLGATILRHEKKCNKKPEFGVVAAAAAPGGEEDKKNKSKKTTRAIIMARACTGRAAGPGTSLKNGEDKKVCSCCSTLVPPLCGDHGQHGDRNHHHHRSPSYDIPFCLDPPPPLLPTTSCRSKQQDSYLLLRNTDDEDDPPAPPDSLFCWEDYDMIVNTDDDLVLFGEEKEITLPRLLLASAFCNTGAAVDHGGDHDHTTKNNPATLLKAVGGTMTITCTTSTAAHPEMTPAGFAALEKACFSDNPEEVDDYFCSLL